MLDFDLAALYEVEARVLNQSVKRNIARFPDDFMFQLTENEWFVLRSQIVTLEQRSSSSQFVMMGKDGMSSQIVMTYPQKRPHGAFPFAFTEQGIAMLSGVLRSEKAVNMNIAIMRAFVAVRRIVLLQHDVKDQLKLIKERIEEHDMQLAQIYDAIENILDEKAAQRKWDDRERIGFRK
jgi:hypothetical protein